MPVMSNSYIFIFFVSEAIAPISFTAPAGKSPSENTSFGFAAKSGKLLQGIFQSIDLLSEVEAY
jgi:hypothetical protein